MKFLSFVPAFAIFVSLHIPALSAPVPASDIGYIDALFERYADDLDLYTLERRAPSHEAIKAVAWLSNPLNAHAINASPTCFYSGHTKNKQVSALLPAFKKTHGCRVVNDILTTAKIDPTKFDPNTRDDWNDVSAAFARAVHGKVIVLLGETVKPTSTWIGQEYPALMANVNAHPIEHYVLEDNGNIKKEANFKTIKPEVIRGQESGLGIRPDILVDNGSPFTLDKTES